MNCQFHHCTAPLLCVRHGECVGKPSSESEREANHKKLEGHLPPSSEKPNAGNNFCRTCGCHFPPDDEDRACRTWEICQEAQAPQSATAKQHPRPRPCCADWQTCPVLGCRELKRCLKLSDPDEIAALG